MISSLIGLCIYVVLGSVAHGSHGDGCPRHRGLPEGFDRGNNSYRDRALYRLDLRHALKGYEPETIYKFRVHTTARKVKFNDATVVVDPLTPGCGPGRLLVVDDTLYSPRGCPDVVTTQEKEPMGRAHFRWQAPKCGCVHIRVRVHANSLYHLEDEGVHNGALARTVCSKDVYEKLRKAAKANEQKEEIVEVVEKQPESRSERFERLCDVSRKTSTGALIKNDVFVGRREAEVKDEYQLDLLHIALAQRRASTIRCCDMGGNEMLECFGDVRRRRIDTFCGTGEPEIPFSKSRYDWIRQRKADCCWEIGEDRYTCFNYTMYKADMPQDQRAEATGALEADLDDFDPFNDIEDFPEHESPDKHESPDSITKKSTPNRASVVEDEPEQTGDVTETTGEEESAELDDNTEDEDDNDENTVERVRHRSSKKSKNNKDKRNQNTNNADESDSDKVGNNGDSAEDMDRDNSNDEDEDNGNLQTTQTAKSSTEFTSTDKPEEETKANTKNVDEAGESDEDKENLENDDEEMEEETKDSSTGVKSDRKFSNDECCLNGITAGTMVTPKGWDGCFVVADKFNKMFTNWDQRCDRRFVMCCMRVIDGEELKSKVALNSQTRPPDTDREETTAVVQAIVSVICGDFNILTNKHICKRNIYSFIFSHKNRRLSKKRRNKDTILPKPTISVQNNANGHTKSLRLKDKDFNLKLGQYKFDRSTNEVRDINESGILKGRELQKYKDIYKNNALGSG